MARIPRASDRIATVEEIVKLAVVDRCRDLLENRIVPMGRIGPNDGLGYVSLDPCDSDR